MKPTARIAFHLGALGSVAASLTHVWAIFAGPEAYASLGAPPDIVASAKAGTLYAPATTLAIALVIFGWAIYAWSALKLIPRMPLLRSGIIAIAGVLLLRGIIIVPLMFFIPEHLGMFAYLSSAICFVLGAVYAIGLVLGWPQLRISK